MNKKAYIKDIAYYLPDTILTNEQIAREFPEWSAEKVASKVGITERHIAAADETATDMAYQAAERLFDQGVDRECIDFVLLCTQSPDYFLPSSACILQDRLGLSKNCGAFDFNLGCSGYEYGLAVAKGLIVAGIAHNILLLTSETYTKYLHAQDKGNRTIFGDGASATWVSTEGFAEIGEVVVGTDGSGAENLIVRSLGAKNKALMNDAQSDEDGNLVSGEPGDIHRQASCIRLAYRANILAGKLIISSQLHEAGSISRCLLVVHPRLGGHKVRSRIFTSCSLGGFRG